MAEEPGGDLLSDSARSTVTLAVLGVLLVVAAVWGWSAATEPLPGAPDAADAPLCEVRSVEKGEKVFRSDVTVSVFNAGGRSGLASETLDTLVKAGFSRGESGNAPPDVGVRFARIWADDQANPAVRLVRRHLNGKPVVSPNEGIDVSGVLVIVGNQFKGVSKGPNRVRVKQAAEICSPSVQ